MAAGNTYVALATNTLSSAAASVTFSNISGAYTDLVLICEGGITDGLRNYAVQLNSDTGSNYSRTTLSGNGTAASSASGNNIAAMVLNDYGYLEGTSGANVIAHFMNYSNTTTYKTVLSRSNNVANGTSANVNMWRSTAAITTILVFASASTFVSGSTFTLYGIAAA
jgi:hypothetical protein